MNGATQTGIVINVLAAMVTAALTAIEPLRAQMPLHLFGILSAALALSNAGLGALSAQWQKRELGSVAGVTWVGIAIAIAGAMLSVVPNLVETYREALTPNYYAILTGVTSVLGVGIATLSGLMQRLNQPPPGA